METLSIDDMQKLNQSIQQIYTLHDLDTFGCNALKLVDRIVRSNVPSFHVTEFPTYKIEETFLPDFPGVSPELQRLKTLHLGEHPFVEHMSQALGGACKISDFISPKQLHSREGIYQQFLRPLDTEDQMCLFLPAISGSWFPQPQGSNLVPGFMLSRSERNFTERDRLVLNLLRPHLIQAHTNAQKYQQLHQDLDRVQQSLNHLGTIVLNGEGRVQSIAPQAIIWLETYFVKSTSCGQLPDHLWSWVKHQVNYLAQNLDLPETCLLLQIQKSGRKLTIRLLIESPGLRYLLLLEEQTLSSLDSLALLGLSQRETEVLALIIQGKDNKAIASQLSVFPSTVRKHLENIYNKLDVDSRTEAIAQALTKLGLLNSLPLS